MPLDYFGQDKRGKARANPNALLAQPRPQTTLAQPQATQAPLPQIQASPTPTNTGAGRGVPAPTSFTNFARIKAANRGVSEREAAAYGQRATAGADKARASLDALRARFSGGVATGTLAAPGPAGTPAVITDESERNDAMIDALGEVPSADPEATSSALYGKSGQTYAGPMGLNDAPGGAEETYRDTLAAEQGLGLLGDDAGMQTLVQQQNNAGNAGTSKLSGALIGQAGRKDFDALRARFNPETELAAAEVEAEKQASAALDTTAANADKWRERGDVAAAYEKSASSRAADKAKRKADEDKSKTADAELRKKFEEAQKSNFGDEANLAFNEFNKVMSPINWITEATGTRDPTQDYLTKSIHGGGGAASGSTSGVKIQWRPEDWDVYKQMDAKQWDALNRMTPSNQRGWIKGRGQELRKEGPWAPGGPLYKGGA